MASSLMSLAASAIFSSVSAAADQVKTDQKEGRICCASSTCVASWGKNIHWVSLKEGQRLAREQKRPAMIVFHKPWCRACKALRPRFANSRDIEQLASDFIMISVEDDDFPRSSELSPDGSYIPRILFLDPEGNVLNQVYNLQGNKQYKYYYAETASIVDSMKQVLKQVSGRHSKKEARA